MANWNEYLDKYVLRHFFEIQKVDICLWKQDQYFSFKCPYFKEELENQSYMRWFGGEIVIVIAVFGKLVYQQ